MECLMSDIVDEVRGGRIKVGLVKHSRMNFETAY